MKIFHIVPAASLLAAVASAPAHAEDAAGSGPFFIGTKTGYNTVAEARAALLAKPGAQITKVPNGDLVVAFKTAEPMIWVFLRPDHFAAPAVVRRGGVMENGVLTSRTDVLCEGSKKGCDRLMAELAATAEKLRRGVRDWR